MKKFTILIVAGLALLPLALSAQASAKFSAAGSKLFLANGKDRAQLLTFVPMAPGKDAGSWRITWQGGHRIAELLIPDGGISLPQFTRKLRVELDIMVEKGTNLLSADLRLLDSQGEVCAMNSSRGGVYTGRMTAKWEFAPGQEFKMAWGKNVNHRIDYPACITNLAFQIQGTEGEVTVGELRLFADPAEPAER